MQYNVNKIGKQIVLNAQFKIVCVCEKSRNAIEDESNYEVQ